MKETIPKLDRHHPYAPPQPVRRVVAALILRAPAAASESSLGERQENPTPPREILICQRRPDQPMSLKWEFPGGKIEPGETSQQALIRELDEELGIDATIGRRVARIRHKYRNGGAIDLQFFLVDNFNRAINNRIFNDIRWAPLTDLPTYDFLAADLGLVRDLAEGRLL